MSKNFVKRTSIIPKGERLGRPIFSDGAKVRFVSMPINPADGSVALTGSTLSFNGSFDGTTWFSVLDPDRGPVAILTSVLQERGIGPGGSTPPAIVPIRNPEYFEGLVMIQPKTNALEAEDREIAFYLE